MARKRLACVSAICAAALALTGCAGMFAKEYVSVTDYEPTVQEAADSEERVTVENFAELKQAILDLAYAGDETGTIVFDQSYDGDTTEDMASACWQVRTQDALCAYCVENIAYEINKIVTINEASVYISYSSSGTAAADIKQIPFSSGIERLIKAAMSEGQRRLAILVNRSGYSADEVESLAANIYRENPTITPRQPTVNVNMYSGNGQQRLYELSIVYGMTADEMEKRMAQLESAKPFTGAEYEDLSEAEKALLACEYLAENCAFSDSASENTAYSALVDGSANSEGVAFAYVELCQELGLECRIVYGQKHWEDYHWNIVEIDGKNYHVDVQSAAESGMALGFLMNDEQFWTDYRWDVASYPTCTDYFDSAALLQDAEPQTDAETEQSEDY